MARLSPSRALELRATPASKQQIIRAQKDAARILMHTQPVSDENRLPMRPIQSFTEWVATMLPKDKMPRFRQLVTMPLDTIESTKGIFDELRKVFDSQDQYIRVEFTDSSYAAEFEQYREQIGESEFWNSELWAAIESSPSSFLVVDMATEQTTDRPAPYMYIISIFDVVDVRINPRTKAVEYLMFTRSDGKVVCLDDEFYRVMAKPENGDWFIETENPHSLFDALGNRVAGLGYTPAHNVYGIELYGSDGLSKRGPISDTLGKLDWILFWRVSKRYLDLYGAYPIMSSYERQCEYRDADQNACVEGFVTRSVFNGIEGDNRATHIQTKCPACEARGMIGPGTVLTVTAPADSSMPDLNENPVRFIEMSNDKLEYGVKEVERLEGEVYLNCVGSDGNAMNTQAVNENQVQANFESKEAILTRVKGQVEKAMRFGLSTMARLQFGENFLACIVDLGNEWFLSTVNDLLLQYKTAKDNGMPMYYVGNLREQIVKTKFKSNPEAQQRDHILRQIEPWPDLSLNQCVGFQLTDPVNFTIKVNFTTFVDRFEREIMNVVEFGSLTNFNEKINTITQKITGYAKERIAEAPSPRPESGANGGPPA